MPESLRWRNKKDNGSWLYPKSRFILTVHARRDIDRHVDVDLFAGVELGAQQVEFEVEEGPKGLQAASVIPM